MFSYRLTRIARGDKTPLAGFDENAWAKTAPHGKRRIADVVDEMIAIRRATLALVDSLDESTIANVGLANNNSVSARAICWIMAGHTQASPRHTARSVTASLDRWRSRGAAACSGPPASAAVVLSRTDSTFAREYAIGKYSPRAHSGNRSR